MNSNENDRSQGLSVDVPDGVDRERFAEGVNVYDGETFVTMVRYDEPYIDRLRAKFQRMYTLGKTPRGDVLVPEQEVALGSVRGFKYAILDQNDKRPVEIKYILWAGIACVFAQVSNAEHSFDESKYESIFATIRPD